MPTAVEACYTLDVSRLLCEGHIKNYSTVERVQIRNHHGEPVWDLKIIIEPKGGTLSAYFPSIGQTLYLHSTPLNFGGRRWWFNCPDCARRCRVLYATLSSSRFSCRLCRRLTYRSSEESHCTNIGAVSGLTRRAKSRWIRRRDRREDYKPRGWRLLECGLDLSPEAAQARARLYANLFDGLERDYFFKD